MKRHAGRLVGTAEAPQLADRILPDLGELINHTEIGNYPHCLSNPNPL